MSGRRFPILGTRRSIPWEVAEAAYVGYTARYGGRQSLERIAERGGFGISELDDLLPDWKQAVEEAERAKGEAG